MPIEWIAGIGVPIISGVIALWVRAHLRQSQRLDDMQKTNSRDHREIHQKIDDTDGKSAKRHSIVIDKIEKIWQHLSKD